MCISVEDESALNDIIRSLERAWNTADPSAFAALFAPDGDQVNIIGKHFTGREEIAAAHAGVFKTIYKGSRNTLALTDARYIANDVVLAHVRSEVSVPEGPRAGRVSTVGTLIFHKSPARWEIVTFHNTRETPNLT